MEVWELLPQTLSFCISLYCYHQALYRFNKILALALEKIISVFEFWFTNEKLNRAIILQFSTTINESHLQQYCCESDSKLEKLKFVESVKIGARMVLSGARIWVLFLSVGSTKIGGRMEEFEARICQQKI